MMVWIRKKPRKVVWSCLTGSNLGAHMICTGQTVSFSPFFAVIFVFVPCRSTKQRWVCLKPSVEMFCTDFCRMCLCLQDRYLKRVLYIFSLYVLFWRFFLHFVCRLSSRTIRSGCKDSRRQQQKVQLHNPTKHHWTLRYKIQINENSCSKDRSSFENKMPFFE